MSWVHKFIVKFDDMALDSQWVCKFEGILKVGLDLISFKTPLHIAASNVRCEIVRLLLQAGADLNAKDVS